MTRPLSDLILDFVATLRAAGIRISPAETLDAMRAIGVAGLALPRMREAMRAALIKDETDNPVFEERFASYFRGPANEADSNRNSRGMQVGVIGRRGTESAADDAPPSPDAQPAERAGARPADHDDHDRPEERDQTAPPDDAGEQAAEAHKAAEQTDREGTDEPRQPGTDDDEAGAPTARAKLRRIERIPFADYSPLEYDQARDALALLRKRWRTRVGRRRRRAQRGRLDFRSTLRASLQHGGVPLERHFRARRPRHLDLVVLADISGSVHYAANLILELLAGAHDEFRRIRSFVFIDRVAAAEFEQGHLVMTPTLNLFARSDFGRVFGEIATNYSSLLNQATVLVILGDGRNNRFPPRPDRLRGIADRCRAVVWLNPEPPMRWGTGDSAIESYRRLVDFLLPCGSLRELEACLAHIL